MLVIAAKSQAIWKLTAWNHNPDEVHEDEIEPKVVWFWSRVADAAMVVVE